MKRELGTQGLLLVVVLAIVFPRAVLSGEYAVASTLMGQWAPWDAVFGDELRPGLNPLTIETVMAFHADFVLAKAQLADGEWPLWNPLQLSGKPLLANFQSAVFYPPRLLHAMLPVPIATTLYVLLKVWLCGMTAYLYGRVAGLQVGASRFLSIAWMLGGFTFTWAYWTPTDVAAWLPVVLIGVELLVRGALRRGFAALMAGGTLLLLAGHPETAFVYGLGAGLYFLLRLATARVKPQFALKACAVALAGWGVALVICSVQLLPFIEYAGISNNVAFRESGAEARHAIPAGDWISFFVPRYFGTNAEGDFRGAQANSTFNSMMYPGMAVWVGVLLALGVLGSMDRRRLVSWAIPTALFGVLAFNFGALQHLLDLPVLSSLWQCYFIGFALFGAAVISATALDTWTVDPRSIRTLYPVVVGLAILVIVTIPKIAFDWSLVQSAGGKDAFAWHVGMAAMLAGFALLFLYLGVGGKRRHITGAGFTFLLLIDLAVAGHGLLPTTPLQHHFPATALTTALRELPVDARVDVVNETEIRPGLMTPYGVEEHWGYDGILPARTIEFYAHLGDEDKAMRFAGVTHRVVPAVEPDDVALGALMIEPVGDAMPRAYVAYDWATEPEKERLFARLRDDSFDPMHTVVLSDAVEIESAGAMITPAEVTSRSATRVVVQADAERPGVLVLLDAFYPGWRATVDGDEAAIVPVNHAFRGVVVSEGNHRVEFQYAPQSFAWGLRGSVAALGLALLAGAIALRFARK